MTGSGISFMMTTQKVVFGLLKQTCRQLQHLMSLALCVFLFGTLPTGAQTGGSSRVLAASYDTDNNLYVQLAIPPDRAISDAFLLFNNEQLSLNQASIPVSIEHWFILDAGVSMINSYSLVADELRDIAAAADDTVRFNGIIAGADPSTSAIDVSAEEFGVWLNSYHATTTNQSCVLDALNQLPERENNPEIIRRVLIISGTGGNECAGASVDMMSPVDIIVIGNQLDSALDTVAAASGGMAIQTTVLGFSQQLSAIEAIWAQTIVILSVPVLETIESAELRVNFENGEQFSQTIFPSGEVILPPTATATASPVPPTATMTETDSPTATSTGIPASDTPEPSPTETNTPPAEETEILSVVVPDVTATPVESPAQGEPSNNNSMVIFVGGVAAIVVVLVVMALLLGYGRTRQKAPPPRPVRSDMDMTLSGIALEAPLDRTMTSTVREMASQFGPTLVANLINGAEDIVYEIHRPVSILGRQPGSDILIAGDTQISREHVRFTTRDNGTIWITRLTRNPILINGSPMETTRQLNDGDEIQLSPNLYVIFETLIPQEYSS